MQFKNYYLLVLFAFLFNCQNDISQIIPKIDSDNGGLLLPDGFGALVVVDSIGESRHLR